MSSTNLLTDDARAYVSTWIGDRENTVLRHGFSDATLRLDWWNERLAAAGLPAGVTIDPHRRGATRLARQDLFELADGLDQDSDDDEYLRLLWHVLAWGSGSSRRNNARRIASFADPAGRRDHVDRLREALVAARDGDVEGAYRPLIRRGGGMIPGLGPAFFTKFLYFAGGGSATSPCLILDARVATSLAKAGGPLPPGGRNWYTSQYVEYCVFLAEWAEEASTAGGPTTRVLADEIERALFAGVPRTT